jgi:hypothetical protein
VTDYVPRGCILTTEAVDRLFEERRPDLVSCAPERAAEIQQLQVLKRAAAKPLAIKPLNSPAPLSPERQRPEFAKKDKARLEELLAIEAEVHSAQEAAAREIRMALAEGDFPAIMLTHDGHEASIGGATWRAKRGLEWVKTGRVRMRVGCAIGETEGRAFVKEIDLITWLSKHAPKPFSKIGINIIVQSSAQPNKASQGACDEPKSAAPAHHKKTAELGLPIGKRGPKGGLTDAAARMMAKDIREGTQTLCSLREMKQESLAATYRVRSRDTALKALRRAAADVGISATDK